MSRNVFETFIGALVLVVALSFGVYAYRSSDLGTGGGYTLEAQFDSVGSLQVGSDVRISGIKVGEVIALSLDERTYRAAVDFTVNDGVELPLDSSAQIASSSLLGGHHLALTPGGDVDMLAEGDRVQYTQSALNLESLVGQAVFGAGGGSGGGEGSAGAGAAASGAASGGFDTGLGGGGTSEDGD